MAKGGFLTLPYSGEGATTMSSTFYGEDLRINLLHGCDGHVGTPFACPLYGAGCWAEGMAKRQRGRNGYWKHNPFRPSGAPDKTWHDALGRLAREGARPKVLAMNFMGDIACQCAANVRVLACALSRPQVAQHTFLWLTKNPARLAEKLGDMRLPENVWLGCSAWDQASLDRNVAALQRIPAAHHWLSLEPLWAPVDLRYNMNIEDVLCVGYSAPMDLNWICVGCESGPRRRLFIPTAHGSVFCQPGASGVPLAEAHFLKAVRSLRDQAGQAGVPLFVKQISVNGEVVKDVTGFPEDLRIQARPWRTP